MTTTTTPAPVETATCDARTGERAGDYGFTPLWCGTSKGLRSYTDRSGIVRRFCANHEAVVRRRYPEAEEPESADPITQAKYRDELLEGVAHFEWHGHDIEVPVVD